MRAFELALHPAKTRLIRFGRHAAKQRLLAKPTQLNINRSSDRFAMFNNSGTSRWWSC
jgi:hypothetical protein